MEEFDPRPVEYYNTAPGLSRKGKGKVSLLLDPDLQANFFLVGSFNLSSQVRLSYNTEWGNSRNHLSYHLRKLVKLSKILTTSTIHPCGFQYAGTD